MKAVTVICEFNPFHNGHIYLLREIKKAFPGHAVISVMSGNTVQRGDFAIQNKYVRAENALKNGSDLVLELPFPFSVSAAEQFARAGVHICRGIKADTLAFGSESGDIEALKAAAFRLSSSEFENALKTAVSSSPEESFISLRDRVYLSLYGEKLFDSGNDILAIEYLKNTEKYNDITPYIIHRTAPFSATAARKAIFAEDECEIKRLIPENSACGDIHGGLRSLSSLILGYLRLTPAEDNGSGIRNAIKLAAEKSTDFDSFISSLPTKTYTLARLRREIFSMIFGVSDKKKNVPPAYTVLLGANSIGLQYLSEKRKEISIPILTKKGDAKNLSKEALLQLETAEKCDSIYALGLKKETGGYFKTPVMIR